MWKVKAEAMGFTQGKAWGGFYVFPAIHETYPLDMRGTKPKQTF